jgi:hypothetical protein
LEESSRGDEILVVSEGEDFYKFVDFEYFDNNWMQPRIRKGVGVKVLIRSDNIDFIGIRELDEVQQRQTKILPKSFTALGAVWIA